MVNDPVANFDRSAARRRGNVGSTGRLWMESTGTVRRHAEGSIRCPRPTRRAEAVDVPVDADADTGYGNPVNVIRTVREYEQAGVAALQLEDQVAPKRCGT